MESSIAALSTKCCHLSEELQSALLDSQCEERSALRFTDVEDQVARLKLWTGNLGGSQKSHSFAMINDRLKQSPKIAFQLKESLETLSAALSNTLAIARGDIPNRQAGYYDDDMSSQSSYQLGDILIEESPLLEAKELFELTKTTITNLFRLVILLRDNDPKDHFFPLTTLYSELYSELYSDLEIEQAFNMFPLLITAGKDWLAVRLATAIFQRRWSLSHARARIQDFRSSNTDRSGAIDEQLTTTTNQITAWAPEDPEPNDNSSDVSSVMSSFENSDSSYTRLASLFKVSGGATRFNCPLCGENQRDMTESSWRKHMYTDLRPYICTFENCELELFPDDNSWFLHEATYHRSRWYCPFCTTAEFQNASQMKTHLRGHGPNATEQQIAALVEASRRVQQHYSSSDCPFCDEWEADLRKSNEGIPILKPIQVTPSQYRVHVGSHMRELALLAIPRKSMLPEEIASAKDDTAVVVPSDVNSGKDESGKTHDLYAQNEVLRTSLPPIQQPITATSKEVHSAATIIGGTKFFFRIDEIRESPNAKSSYDKDGTRQPPISYGDKERIFGVGATGMLWCCHNEGIQHYDQALPPGSSFFQACSVIYSTEYGFWILRGDATSPTPGEAWHPLSFDWDDQDYSSYVTNAGLEHTLRVQRNDQRWPAMLLPSKNQTQAAHIHQGHGGLKGDISIFLALIAFSMDPWYMEQNIPRMFNQGVWAVHDMPHGRLNQRGVVVYVYTCPSSWGGCTAKNLEQYQDGVYGKYYS